FAFLGRFQASHEAQDEPRVIGYDDLPAFLEAMFAGARRGGLDPAACDAHAGVVETSVMLAIAPQLVRDFAGIEGYTAAEPGFLDRALADGLSSLTATGILGSPAGATAV